MLINSAASQSESEGDYTIWVSQLPLMKQQVKKYYKFNMFIKKK
jgi:hypothetical protein